MHKGIILLVKRDNKNDALTNARNFLEDYGEGRVWDWYQIGGRWQGTLAPMSKEFFEKSNNILKKDDAGFISDNDIKNNATALQELWESLGGKGDNPYSDNYHMPEDRSYYDVIPLKECISVVKEWQQDPEKEGKAELEKANDWLQPKREKNEWGMYGYCLEKAGKIFQQEFCFDCNVFNIEKFDYSIPEDLNGWYAVMIDIHN